MIMPRLMNTNGQRHIHIDLGYILIFVLLASVFINTTLTCDWLNHDREKYF